ncbi:MAG: alpha/beta hydrolase [Gammaproteobacteria bacterium]|nr:alpha/beta hydrolase [Gammaproteobacteria bacterium]
MKMVFKIKFKNKFLVLISIIIFPLIVFAQGQYDKIANVAIYSEYYPNPQARFQGTIIFENGSINTVEEWKQNKNFLDCVSQYGGIFMYDHNGLGKSPPDLSTSVKNPITAKLINNKLIALLQKRHIKPPYILVAHSYGGLYAGYFARKYPNLAKGVLMIDPLPNNSEFPERVMAEIDPLNKLAQQISNKEMYNKYSYKKAIEHKLIPAEVVYHMLGFEQTKKEINQLPTLSNNIPIIVLSSSWMEEHKLTKTGDWYEKQRQWINSNPNSKIIKVPGGHFIHREHPELVCEQIKVLVALASCATPNKPVIK